MQPETKTANYNHDGKPIHWVTDHSEIAGVFQVQNSARSRQAQEWDDLCEAAVWEPLTEDELRAIGKRSENDNDHQKRS